LSPGAASEFYVAAQQGLSRHYIVRQGVVEISGVSAADIADADARVREAVALARRFQEELADARIREVELLDLLAKERLGDDDDDDDDGETASTRSVDTLIKIVKAMAAQRGIELPDLPDL